MVWPCRVAEKTKVECPRCGRAIQAKNLIYSHVCKGSPEERAIEIAARAKVAFQQRVGTPPPSRRVGRLFEELDASLAPKTIFVLA